MKMISEIIFPYNKKKSYIKHFLTLLFALFALTGSGVDFVHGEEIVTDLDQGILEQNQYHPVIIDSAGRVGIAEVDDTRILVFKNELDLRQGELRLVAERAIVFITTPSSKKVNFTVYAEGSGRAGEKAESPVYLKTPDHEVTTASVMNLSLQTLQGISWECGKYAIDDVEKVRFYERALKIRKHRGSTGSYSIDRLPEVELEPREPVEPSVDMLRADTVRIFTREEEGKIIAVYMGNVYGTYLNVDISADLAILWLDSETREYEIYARGNIILQSTGEGRNVLEREGLETLKADRIYVNPSEEKGLLLNTELRVRDAERAEIYVIRGEEAYILDRRNLLLHEAGTTNCPHGIPHYEFLAEKLQFTQQPSRFFVSGWNFKMVFGKRQIPALWVPYMGVNLDRQTYLLRSVSAGRSSSFGTTVETRWDPTDLGDFPEWLDEWTASVDYFSKRGTGLGSDIQYSFGEQGGIKQEGEVTGYYIEDTADEDSLGRAVPRSDRGRFQLFHRADWSNDLRTDFEYNHLSDHTFLREYFRSDFTSHKAPETQVHSRFRRDHVWGGGQFKVQSNDFLTQREALPGFELHTFGIPLGPLVYDASYDAGLYRYTYSERLDGFEDTPEVLRLHSEQRLSLPFRWGFLKIDPFARALGTYARRSVDEVVNDDIVYGNSVSRTGASWGARVGTDLSRVYNVSSSRLNLNRMRHIVSPYIEAERLEVDEDSANFIQMRGEDPWPRYGRGPRERDDWIDAIDDADVLRTGLRQRFQTKRNGVSVDWLSLDLEAVFRDEDSVAIAADGQNDGSADFTGDDNYLLGNLTWKLTDKLELSSENNRMSLDDGFDVFNAGISYKPINELDTSLRYNKIKDRTSNISAQVDIDLSERYSLSFRERYEFDRSGTGRSQNMRTDVMISRWFHKWLLQVEVFYDGRGDRDTGVFVRFSPSFFQPMGRGEGFAVW